MSRAVRIFIIACCFVALVLVLYGQGVSFFFADWSERGTFGDAFGAVNALFSGIALAGVVAALYLQTRELRLQREELALTRTEMTGQKLELARQANLLALASYTQARSQLDKPAEEISRQDAKILAALIRLAEQAVEGLQDDPLVRQAEALARLLANEDDGAG